MADTAAVRLQEPLTTLARDPSQFPHDLQFPEAEAIRICDDTLRDGEQMPGVAFSPEVKYEIARRLSDIGVHSLVAGFPAVSSGEQETLRLIQMGRMRGELRDDLEVMCMARTNRGDIDATARVLERMNVSPAAVTYLIFTSGSDLHIKYKLGRHLLEREGLSTAGWLEHPVELYRAANIRMTVDAIRYARSLGATDIAFGAEDGSRADTDYLVDLHRAARAAGAGQLVLADTVGCYSPQAVSDQVARVRAGTPDGSFSVHFHNDLGLGAWNSLVALGSGADCFMTSVNGIGERTGNAPLHQVLMQLRYLFGIELPGFRYERLRDLARYMERVSGIPVQPTEPGIGHNVFSHESGIHTAGMLIHPAIYQFIPPGDLGADIAYVYGKHSGTMVVERALANAGLDHSPETVARVVTEVKRIREERSGSGDFVEFHRSYYRHLAGMGVSLDEVVELGRQLAPVPQAASRT